MSKEFKFTDPGEGLQEAEILEIHVSDGDSVSEGDIAISLETDKATTEIPVPFTGTIEEVKVSEGDTVEVGDVLMTYSEGEESGESEEEESGQQEESSDSEQEETEQAAESSDQDKESQEQEASGQKQAESQQEQSKSGGEKKGKEKQQSGGKQQPVAAAPSTRRLAREKGVDLHSIEPSGKQGRVTAEDVEAAAGEQEQRSEQERPTTSLLTPSTVPPQVPDFSQWGEVEREPLRSIRRATARNMAQSWAQVPHVFHEDVADITELERFRRAHEVKHGKLTVTVLMMKALVAVLKRFPRFNASLDVQNQEIVYKHYFHIGLAVATERGLLVPVIRDVDRKSVTELAAESADMAQKTRNGELSRADMSGGCITITNPGSMGGSSLTPLINLPQVAILGMAQARLQPVAEGDLDDYRITARLHLPLVLGFDHRVNDGAEAAQFVTALIDTLADPESLLMAV